MHPCLQVKTRNPNSRGIVSYGPYQSGGWRLQNLATETRSPRAKVMLVESVPSGICQPHLHFTGMETGPGSIIHMLWNTKVRHPSKRSPGKQELTMGMQGAWVYVQDFGQGVQVARADNPVIISFSCCKSCEPCRRGSPASGLREIQCRQL